MRFVFLSQGNMDQFSMLLDHDADPSMGLDKTGRNLLHLLATLCTEHDLRRHMKIVLKKVRNTNGNLKIYTVNPLLSPPGGAYFFQALLKEGLIERGRLKERRGLFNLAKCITCSKNLPPVYQQLSRSRTSWTFAYRIIISAV